MKTTIDRRKIIGALFILALILLAVNLLVSKSTNPYISKKTGKRLTADELKADLFLALHNVGLQDDWIKLKKNYRKRDNSLPTYYSIEIPEDLPIPLVVKEITNEFEDSNIQLVTEEQKFNGNTEIKFYSNDELELDAELAYNDNIWRDAGYIGLMVLLPQNIRDAKLQSLLDIPEYFTFVLVPSKTASGVKKKIKNHDKNYAILLDDNIQPMEYSLKSSYPDFRIKNAISSIVGNFSDADFFIIDNSSNIYASKNYDIIKEGFQKRKIKLFEENSFVNLTNESGSRMENDFENTVSKTGKSKSAEIIISADDLEDLMNEISKFRKVGYKFVYSSSLLNQ
jgi:hypothetical protein